MDKVYKANTIEDKWYQLWEKAGYFTPKIDKSKKPFSILLPLPNANDPMHMGHALFTIQDIMIRYHRMLGESTLWLPGADHAGIETQFVFEKHLAKQDKSRFDFDRNTLYKMIWEFVEKNRAINRDQLKKLGFSLDWTRYHYSLEPEIVEKVMETFRKLHRDGLIYRGERIVNFCTKCGTAFSDLEVNYEEKEDFLYFLSYGKISIATTRPETIFADVAVAVNPKDRKYLQKPQKAVIPIIGVEVPVITDPLVQKEFGTGALKITPGYDPVDFEIGQRNDLPIVPIMNRYGRLDFSHPRFVSLNNKIKDILKSLEGLKVKQAREKTVELLEKEGTLVKKIPYKHAVGTCYRCKTTIEPMVIPQWFIKMKPLAKPAIEAVKTGRTKIVPKKRFEKMYFDWLKNIRDWNISRQIVWGPRIPVWYCLDCNPEIKINFINKEGERINDTYRNLKDKYTFEEINAGLQSMMAGKEASYQLSGEKCNKCNSSNILQETDTFDTWFLSGQWPLTTLGADFSYFYPTSVLDTLWDILFFWVAKMMMLGLYITGEVPFKVIHLHARVVDKFGQKMSKSKGNVIDPLVITQKYGADALRFALVMGVAPASDICLSEEKIVGMRNFTNKLWNIGRFIRMNIDTYKEQGVTLTDFREVKNKLKTEDKKIIKQLDKVTKEVTKSIDNYHFGRAAEDLYTFIWHTLADKHLESIKNRLKSFDNNALVTLIHIYTTSLKLLHPFMPFITEEINQQINLWDSTPLIISPWPKN